MRTATAAVARSSRPSSTWRVSSASWARPSARSRRNVLQTPPTISTRPSPCGRATPLADLADQPGARVATQRLEELRLRALELRNDARLEPGGHDSLLPELEELIAGQPYRERLREQQILALDRAGRQKDALEAYQRARRALVEEL